MKEKSDADIMIEILDNAIRHSENLELHERKRAEDFNDREYAIVGELIDAEMLVGDHDRRFRSARLERITLKGRLFRDTLIAQRNAKTFPVKIKRWAGWFLAAVVGASIKHLLEVIFGG